MNCEQITPYLPGYAGGDLRAETTHLIAEHLKTCSDCRQDAERLERMTASLASLRDRAIEPPAMLLESVLSSIPARRAARRFVPPIVPPQVAPDLIRVVQDNREAIASAGAAAVVAAGAAYALWRAVQRRPGGKPATT